MIRFLMALTLVNFGAVGSAEEWTVENYANSLTTSGPEVILSGSKVNRMEIVPWVDFWLAPKERFNYKVTIKAKDVRTKDGKFVQSVVLKPQCILTAVNALGKKIGQFSTGEGTSVYGYGQTAVATFSKRACFVSAKCKFLPAILVNNTELRTLHSFFSTVDEGEIHKHGSVCVVGITDSLTVGK